MIFILQIIVPNAKRNCFNKDLLMKYKGCSVFCL